MKKSNSKTAFVNSQTILNDKLKKKGLWVKGMQFLSNKEKELLLANTDKMKKKIYNIIDNKMESVARHSYTNMKERMKANGGKIPWLLSPKKKTAKRSKKLAA
jgi:hypothetical protein